MNLYKYLRRRLVSKQLLMPMSEVSPKLSGSRNQSKKLKTKIKTTTLAVQYTRISDLSLFAPSSTLQVQRRGRHPSPGSFCERFDFV